MADTKEEGALKILRLLYGTDSNRFTAAADILKKTPTAATAILDVVRADEFKGKLLDLGALVWLRGTAKLSAEVIPDTVLASRARSEALDKLGVMSVRGELLRAPAAAGEAAGPKIEAGQLIEAEIERRLKEAKKPEDFARIRDEIIQQAKDGEWLTKPAAELAAGPLKSADDYIKAREAERVEAAKKYDPRARARLEDFTAATAAPSGPAGTIKVGADGSFAIDLGRHKATQGTDEGKNAADARSLALVSGSFLELMRAAAAADPAKFQLNTDMPQAPNLRNPADVTRYNSEVAAFMKANPDALKALRAAGVVGDSGTIDFTALKKAGVDVRAAAAVAAAPAELKAQAEAMLKGLGQLVDRNRGNDAEGLAAIGIKREDVGAPSTGDVFTTSRASHEAVRRASAILAERGVTPETLAAARAAAAEALKGGVKPANARDEAATAAGTTMPALKAAQAKVAAAPGH